MSDNPQSNYDSDAESSTSRPIGPVSAVDSARTDIPDIGLHLGASRRTMPALGLNFGASSSRAGPSGVRPPVQRPNEIHIWPHLEERVQMRPRAPSPPRHPFLAEMMEKKKWQCAVCGDRFYIVSALSGHMRVHKNRGWKGITPPPEFLRPLPGLRIGGNYPPSVSSNLNLELTLGPPRPLIPRHPALHFDYDAIAARMDRKEKERVLRKRLAPPALGESSNPEIKSKRPIEGGVKDLNDSLPSDKSDEGPLNKPDEGGTAGNNNAT